MRELFQMKMFLSTGKFWSTIYISLIVFLTTVGGKPTRLLPKQALEKIYHKMIQGKKTTGDETNQLANQGNSSPSKEPLQELLKKQYSAFDVRDKGMAARVLIYSIASKGYLTVNGGIVNGKGSRKSKNAIIVIESIGFNAVRLRGENSKKYICFNDKGKIEGKENGDHPNCIFIQYPLMNHYTAFRSIGQQSKWIGIRPRGTVKKGRRTKRGQRATKFVTIRL